jgi:predicted RNase H-like nuclease
VLRPEHQARVREVHPELIFMQWNCGEPIAHGKKTPTGRQLRMGFVAENFGPGAFEQVRQAHARSDVADDDICDAFAALFTARRIWQGSALPVPEQPTWDRKGLRMEMWV